MTHPFPAKIVALTGGIACGKSTISQWFAEQGICIVDTDIIAREIVSIGSPLLAIIADHFGQDILNADTSLNRQALRHIIFNDPTEKQWLEMLMHPVIHQKMQEALQQCRSPYAIAVIPLLVETNKPKNISEIWNVNTSIAQQVARLTSRDHISIELAHKMIAAQASHEHRNKIADKIIHNQDDLSALYQQLEQLHQQTLAQLTVDAQLTP